MSSPKSSMKELGLGGTNRVRDCRVAVDLGAYDVRGDLGDVDRMMIAGTIDRIFRPERRFALAIEAEPTVEGYDELFEEDHAEAVRFLMGLRGWSQFRAYRRFFPGAYPLRRKAHD